MTQQQKGKTGSIFARPATALRSGAGAPRKRSPLLRPTAWLIVGGFIGIACAFVALQPKQSRTQVFAKPPVKRAATLPPKPVQVALAEKASPASKSADATRPSLDFYTKGVRGSMFSAPQPPQVKEPALKVTKVIVPSVKPVILNPFADWNYSGTVTAGDKKMALLENRTSKEGQYVQEGQTFMGAKVKGITDQMVTLVSGGKPYPLAKSDDINVLQLANSASYLTQQPQQPQPQTAQTQYANQMMMMGQMQMDPNAQGMTLPNGRTLTADQAARFQRRMNGRFNGGGGPGGGGGYGGGRGGGRGGRGGGLGGPGGGGAVMVAPRGPGG